jgi:Transcription factor WhiB
VSGEQTKTGRGQGQCAGCQVRDHCLELAVKAAGGLGHDHGVFGGALPAERSRQGEAPSQGRACCGKGQELAE